MLKKLIIFGTHHILHGATEALYLKVGYDVTKPLLVRGLVSERCNYKCRYCDSWRKKEYPEEITIPQWQATLLSLKEFIGRYVIQFSGGEQFIKKGFVDLLKFCHDEGIGWGVMTNGSAFNRHIVEKVVAAKPMNIDISVDSATAEIHDYVRGVPNSLNRITEGIGFIREERDRLSLKFPIRIKPTVHFHNFRILPELVDWAKRVGATTIDFSPVRLRTVDTELWIRQESDLKMLRQIVETLITMKQDGAPIETSNERLRTYPEHFLGKKIHPSVSPCRVALRNYHIMPNGDVSTCWFYPIIGNVKKHSARDIWHCDKAKRIRAQTVVCTKFGSVSCANSCLAHRSFMQEIKRALLFFQRGIVAG
jgi:radical SAM protein with 4Fe4S-binding SPASM domain